MTLPLCDHARSSSVPETAVTEKFCGTDGIGEVLI